MRVPVGCLSPETTPFQKMLDTFPELVTTREAMDLERFTNDSTDTHAWIEGTRGILKDDLHLASNVAHRGSVHVEQVLAVVSHDTRGRRDEAENGPTDRGFSTAGLTNQTKSLTRLDPEAHTIDCTDMIHHSLEDSSPNREVGLEILDFKQRAC
jgi:hypothetical protein